MIYCYNDVRKSLMKIDSNVNLEMYFFYVSAHIANTLDPNKIKHNLSVI